MDITLDKRSNTEALIKVTLNEGDYQQRVNEKLKEYSKKMNLKGFRPGKVPPALVKKMYGKSILVEEINELLSKSVNDYIKNNDLKIIGDPLPNQESAENIDWDTQKEFDFEYEIGMVDDFSYELDKKYTRHKVKIDDKFIKETVEDLKFRYGQRDEVDEASENDMLEITLMKEPGEDEKNIWLELKDQEKTIKKQFAGAEKEQEVTIDIRKLKKKDEELAELLHLSVDEVKEMKGNYIFRINKITKTTPMEEGQEFYDTLFGKDAVKSEDEFKNKLTETFESNYDRETEAMLAEEIRKDLIKNTKIEMPAEFLKKWLKASNKDITDDKLEEEFDQYVEELKWMLIQNKIAEDKQIQIEAQDVIDRTKNLITQQFMSSGIPPEQLAENLDAMAQNYLQQENGQNYMNVHNQIRSEKVIDKIKEEAKIEEKSISIDKFKELASN